ncbi:MAG: HAD family phosphatase [Planctomycetaceae bacterium]|nr:HAD family phosphatase [Planctomycetaceae bacterium]
MTTSAIKAVTFDLDGVIVNTEDIFHLTGTELLRRRGKTPTKELFHAMMGRRAHESFQNMIDLMELTESIDELAAESGEIFDSFLNEHLDMMPGFLDLLAIIDEKQLPRAVATSSDRAYVHRILGKFDLLDRFDFFLTAEDVTHGKPNPEIYLKAAEKLGVQASEMLVFEDSENGTRAAAAAGAHIISVPHQHSAHHDFSVAKAIAVGLHDPVIRELLLN